MLVDGEASVLTVVLEDEVVLEAVFVVGIFDALDIVLGTLKSVLFSKSSFGTFELAVSVLNDWL